MGRSSLDIKTGIAPSELKTPSMVPGLNTTTTRHTIAHQIASAIVTRSTCFHSERLFLIVAARRFILDVDGSRDDGRVGGIFGAIWLPQNSTPRQFFVRSASE